MACAFPGMDPYLEIPPYWSDFLPAFLTATRNRLIPTLLPKYDVRLEEYLLLEHGESPNHRVRPDVVVSSHGQADIHVSGTCPEHHLKAIGTIHRKVAVEIGRFAQNLVPKQRACVHCRANCKGVQKTNLDWVFWMD